jgi:hypothetical protein
MSSDFSHAERVQIYQEPNETRDHEAQGVDLSEHTNHSMMTRMERAQAQWTKLLVDGTRMATRPFENFHRPVLSKVNER